MIESLNKKVDLVENGTSFLGLGDYGKIMIGDKAFEFYSDHSKNNYIQIPWTEVDIVIVSVVFKRWIPRFAIKTKKNGMYSFASRDPKKVLRSIREYIPKEKILKSLNFWQVLRNNIIYIFKKKNM